MAETGERSGSVTCFQGVGLGWVDLEQRGREGSGEMALSLMPQIFRGIELKLHLRYCGVPSPCFSLLRASARLSCPKYQVQTRVTKLYSKKKTNKLNLPNSSLRIREFWRSQEK